MSLRIVDMMEYAKIGAASKNMKASEKLIALSLFGGSSPVFTVSGVPPLSFQSDGTPLTAWTIAANMVQDGTPTHSDPIVPQEVGDLVVSGEHAGEYAIPITCGGTTKYIYLQEPIRKIGDYADTVSRSGVCTREIRKLVLTGEEADWTFEGYGSQYTKGNIPIDAGATIGISSHFAYGSANTTDQFDIYQGKLRINAYGICIKLAEWKAYLAEQYANGTPVTVWYVLAEPETETVTAPKITTAKGSNTLSIGTTLQPSSVSITGHISES